MDKILSIIIPTYNMEKYLRRCLDSLLIKENIEMLEIWVVNDGSKDSSSIIAHEYADKYPDVFNVIDKQNGNYGSCINAALPRCTGKFVKVLDSDDYFDTNNFQRFLNRLKTIDTDVVLSNYTHVYADGHKMSSEYKYKDNHVVNLATDTPEHLEMHGVTYKLSLLKQMDYKQTEGVSYTDQEWIFYPMLKATDLSYCDINVYQYVIGREGQTMDANVLKRNVLVIIMLMSKMIEHMKQCKQILSTSRRLYAENMLEGQIKLIYNIELVRLDKEESHVAELRTLDSLIASYDKDFYDKFNEVSIRKIMPVTRNFRGGGKFLPIGNAA